MVLTILGLSLGHDTGAALVEVDDNTGDYRVVRASHEERYSRRKVEERFPREAVRFCLAEAGGAVDAVAWTNESRDEIWSAAHDSLEDQVPPGSPMADVAALMFEYVERFGRDPLLTYHRTLMRLVPGMAAAEQGLVAAQIRHLLDAEGLRPACPMARVPHHEAHAMTALATCPPPAAALVVDGFGDDESITTWTWAGGRPVKRSAYPLHASPALVYMFATSGLGFKMLRHEGKVTGLAAYGSANGTAEAFRALYRPDLLWDVEPAPVGASAALVPDWAYLNGLRVRVLGMVDEMLNRGTPREDIAAGVQVATEEVVLRHVDALGRLAGDDATLALAGGYFANVKANQRVKAAWGRGGVWVFPAMSDLGLALGAALAAAARRGGLAPRPLPHVFLGDDFTGGSWQDEAPALEQRVAELLADGHTVLHHNGPMEYGPRALGNRSILCRATDPGINAWLNQRLRRTEFMPFAPVVLAERAGACFQDLAGAERAAEFMTITVPCTAAFRRDLPAAVHVDGTARPQLVTGRSNPRLCRILRRYEALTGLPGLINTSANLHEEPIVRTPDEARRCFEDSGLDVLVVGEEVTIREAT